MIDEAHKLRRDEPGSAPDRPAREGPAAEPARGPAASVSPFGVDDDILRRAAALPGFATFRPVAQRPPPAAAEMTEPEDANPQQAEPAVGAARAIEPEPAAAAVLPAEPDEPDRPEAVRPEAAQAVVFTDADMVAPRRLDLTSIDRSLQRIADVLERRLGEIAERPHRLRDLGVAPRVPVPAAPEPAVAGAADGQAMPEPEAAAVPEADATEQAAPPVVVPAAASAPGPASHAPPSAPAPARRPLSWGWAFLIGLAIFGGVVGAALSGWLPEPAGRLTAPLEDLLADWLARWR